MRRRRIYRDIAHAGAGLSRGPPLEARQCSWRREMRRLWTLPAIVAVLAIGCVAPMTESSPSSTMVSSSTGTTLRETTTSTSTTTTTPETTAATLTTTTTVVHTPPTLDVTETTKEAEHQVPTNNGMCQGSRFAAAGLETPAPSAAAPWRTCESRYGWPAAAHRRPFPPRVSPDAQRICSSMLEGER